MKLWRGKIQIMVVEFKILIHLHDNDIIIHKISVKREIVRDSSVKSLLKMGCSKRNVESQIKFWRSEASEYGLWFVFTLKSKLDFHAFTYRIMITFSCLYYPQVTGINKNKILALSTIHVCMDCDIRGWSTKPVKRPQSL
jgi:hypothetical protein